jgi:hypothetical protein
MQYSNELKAKVIERGLAFPAGGGDSAPVDRSSAGLAARSLTFNDGRDTRPQPAKRWRDSVYGVFEKTIRHA